MRQHNLTNDIAILISFPPIDPLTQKAKKNAGEGGSMLVRLWQCSACSAQRGAFPLSALIASFRVLAYLISP